MDRGNQFYGSISSHELPLAATNGPILRKTTNNYASRTAEEKHVSIISRLIDTEKNLNTFSTKKNLKAFSTTKKRNAFSEQRYYIYI